MKKSAPQHMALRGSVAAVVLASGVLGLAGPPASADAQDAGTSAATPVGTPAGTGDAATAAAAASAPASDTGDQLQEVVVTANRSRQLSQNVPIAVAAFSAATTRKLGITDAMALAAQVPGLTFNRQSNASIPFLRGIGTPVGQSGDEPSVALYVDDVYIPAGSASLANLNSISRIEVEKGPQGTLFGRNATGGVVQVFTRDPSSTPSVNAQVGYANYDTTSGSVYATGPLTSTLSGNIALYTSNQKDGWGTNLLTGNPAYKAWDNGGRAKLLWRPSDAFSALLTYDLDTTRAEEGLVYNAFPGTASVPGIPGAPGYYDVNDADSRSITRQQGLSLKLTSDFSWARLVSISAWRYTHAFQGFAYDPIPLPFAYVYLFTPEKTLTQEVRLASPESSTWRWTLGAYYFNDNAGYDPLKFTGLLFAPLPYLDTYGLQKTISWSAFADATHAILPETNLTAGLRYTTDMRTLQAATLMGGAPGGPIPSPNSPQSAKWDKLTYRLILDHHFTPDVMGYIGYNVGFKSGIFNTVITPFSPINAPVKPETLDAYTVGEKAEFLGHRLRVNTEFFYYKDKDIQVDEVNGPATYITNAASATFKGVDLDVTMIPVDRLTLTASFEALDGKYGSFPNGQYWVYSGATGGNCAFGPPAYCGLTVGSPGAPPAFNGTSWNLKGNKTINSPPFSSVLTASYEIPTQLGNLDTTASWTHTGNYYADPDNGLGQLAPSSPNNDRQQILNLLNASVEWMAPDGHWNARLWGKNLTGQQYWSYAQEDAFVTEYSAAAPRTYGVTLGTEW